MNPKLDMHNITDLSANALEQDLTDGKHFNVLIVDDSTSIRNIISSTLKKAGYEVSSAKNGKEAWQIMETWQKEAKAENKKIEDYVQAVVSDIEMPEMDGHALTRKLKSDSNLKHIPVVLFSSIITNAMRYKGENAGADEQYSKPDLPSLTINLRKIIANKLGI